MAKKTGVIFCAVCIFTAILLMPCEKAISSDAGAASVELARYGNEFSSVHFEPARMGSRFGLAVIFEGTKDLHYYANPESSPAPGFELKVKAEAESFSFGNPILPAWEIFSDPTGKKVQVYAGNFTIFVPIEAIKSSEAGGETTQSNVNVIISGQACTSVICLLPFERTLQTNLDWTERDSWKQISIKTIDIYPSTHLPINSSTHPPIWFALGLAFVAGAALNVMPCVWPVLPLIVMRLISRRRQRKAASIVTGFAFCLGILLFFASLAGANIILKVFYGTVLQWGDQFRSPTFVIAMVLLLVVLALFMFGLFNISLPVSLTGKSGSGNGSTGSPSRAKSREGYAGTVGMGMLAAVLSTPCSFGILAAAFAWAQAQTLLLASSAIMVIGAGMAFPYAILISMPGLLNHLPSAGRWMQLFKETVGFILLLIAVKLVAALPQARIADVLYFAVTLSFCVWMWGGWVTYNTRPRRKWLIRALSVALASGGGWLLLSAPAQELIEWQPYDSLSIEAALKQQQPVLIKFTADWCLSCQTAEKMVYSRKDIAKLIEQKGVLAIKADTTQKNAPATVALKDIYNEPGVPVTILFTPGNKEPLKWRGILFAGALKKLMQELPDKLTKNQQQDKPQP